MGAGFTHDIAGGSGKLIVTALQSPNFSIAEQTGWAIMKNGDAWFFNVVAEGSVTANTVVLSGTGDGLFMYSGLPAFGNLVMAIANAAGEDEYGNPYRGPGIVLSPVGGPVDEIQIRPDLSAILFYGS